MQVQSVNNQNKNINFSGLYKIPAKGIGETVSNLVEKHNCLKVPSSYLAPKYWYILTPESKEVEEEFEKTFLEHLGKYWKAHFRLGFNRQVCEKIFETTKLVDNKENWVEAEVKHGLDVQF